MSDPPTSGGGIGAEYFVAANFSGAAKRRGVVPTHSVRGVAIAGFDAHIAGNGERLTAMEMSGEFRIPAPRQRVWEGLNDPEILKRSIPGCQTIEKVSDTDFAAKVGAIFS